MENMRKKMVLSKVEARQEYTRHVRILFATYGLYFPVLILGFNNFSGGTDAEWFQRCGALLVGVSVLGQFRFTVFRYFINVVMVDYGDGNPRTHMQDYMIKSESSEKLDTEPSGAIIFDLMTFVIGFLGTIIWGYGDLIYNMF
jgi:hypothetical protein